MHCDHINLGTYKIINSEKMKDLYEKKMQH